MEVGRHTRIRGPEFGQLHRRIRPSPSLTTLRRNLAATLPIEYTPQSEIFREVLVVMLGPCCDEEKIA